MNSRKPYIRKILLGTSSAIDSGSGINTYVKEIGRALTREGHRVLLVGPEPVDRQWLNTNEIELISVDQNSNPEIAAQTILRKIVEDEIDGIINNDNSILQCIAPVVDCPFVSVMHLGFTNVATLASYNIDWLDHLVVISNEMRYRALTEHHAPPAKTPLVYNGIEDPCPDWSPKRSTGDRLKILYNGGTNKRKGFDLLIKAIQRHEEKWQNKELHLYGHFETKTADKLSRYPFVTIHGRVTRAEMLEALKETDVFLMPSRHEGCPMALVEAMAYGTAPISSDGEGAMDVIVESGINGFICQLEKWDTQLMECLDLLDGNRDILEHMSSGARQKFVEFFNVRETIQNLLQLIDTPTVDRSLKPEKINILRWHRPRKTSSMKAPLIDRVCIRLGWLRKYGTVRVDAFLDHTPQPTLK